VHGLEQKWGDEINFVYLDIDDSRTQEFKRQLGYQYQPHLFLIDGQGNVVEQWLGYVEAQDLEPAFERVTQ
jgi:hypothetical protein